MLLPTPTHIGKLPLFIIDHNKILGQELAHDKHIVSYMCAFVFNVNDSGTKICLFAFGLFGVLGSVVLWTERGVRILSYGMQTMLGTGFLFVTLRLCLFCLLFIWDQKSHFFL